MNAISQFSVQSSRSGLDNRRVAAGAVDLAVVAFGGLLLSLAAGGSFTPLLGAVTVGWGLFYSFACETANGQTLGKRLFDLRVESASGGAADDRAIALRTLLRVVDGIGFYVVGLVVMLASGGRRQRLGDSVAGTVVVSSRGLQVATSRPAVAAKAPAPKPAAEKKPLKLFGLPLTRSKAAPAVKAEAAPSEKKPFTLFGLPLTRSKPAPAVSEAVEENRLAEEERAFAEEPFIEDEADFGVDEDFEDVAEAEEEPVAEEPEEEPVAKEEPVAERDEADTEPEKVDPELPRVASPALEDLAKDVAATAGTKPDAEEEPVASEEAEDEPKRKVSREPVEVKPIETVSPIELVMDQSEPDPEPAEEPARRREPTRGGAA